MSAIGSYKTLSLYTIPVHSPRSSPNNPLPSSGTPRRRELVQQARGLVASALVQARSQGSQLLYLWQLLEEAERNVYGQMSKQASESASLERSGRLSQLTYAESSLSPNLSFGVVLPSYHFTLFYLVLACSSPARQQ